VASPVVLAAVVLVGCAWLTGLLPPLFLADGVTTSKLYDQQVSSWLQGRWDLPAGGAEPFQIEGRNYIYFGPTPALLRLPFASWVTVHPGKSGFPALWLAALTALAAGLLVAYEVTGDAPRTVFVLGLLGPVLIIASRPSVYHEAIAWGAALILLTAALILRYRRRPSVAVLVLAALCGVLAVLAREIWLPSAAVMMALPVAAAALPRHRPFGTRIQEAIAAPRPTRVGPHVAVAATAIVAVIGAPLAVHRIKFGEWGLVPPIEKHAWFGPEKVARIGGRMFHVSNLRTGLYNYLSPSSVRYDRSFPWIHSLEPRLFPETRLDGFAAFLGLPHAAGALMLLTMVGLAASLRDRSLRWPALIVLGLGLGSGALFFFVGLCGRYIFDFLPPLAVGGALGIRALARHPRGRILMAGVAALAAYNAAAGAALALEHQRYLAPPPRREEVERIVRRIDDLCGAVGAETKEVPSQP